MAPSDSIRPDILSNVSEVPALVVLLTPPNSAWVWLEAGTRFGSRQRAKPLFVLPSARFVSLLQPVSDLRGLHLDDDGEVHELVQAVAKNLYRRPVDYLVYKLALEDLVASAVLAYPAPTWITLFISWLKKHAPSLPCGLGLVTLAYGVLLVATTNRAPPVTDSAVNDLANARA